MTPGVGLFSKENISKGGDKKRKVKKKGSRAAYNMNKQTTYIAPKSKMESRVH